MTYREAFTNLIQILGQLYSDQASIRRIIIQVNLPIEQILFSGRADNTWADVLYKARRHDKVEGIFAIVLAEYPAVSDLHTAVAGYREVVARGDVPLLPLRRCDFYAHVSLPPNFVARPGLLREVRDVLLAAPATALTSAIPMDALHGMGGIGKSVVARALCDDPEVQAAFSDAILWATIGQSSELIPRLREWVEELGGIIPQTAPTINQLKQNLAELLTDRACLLILDDVWLRADAEPFLVGGPRCRLLLTTRDSEVARGVGAAVHSVPVMDPDEALTLLDQWAGERHRQPDEAVKRQIVRRLGYLPLAIKLAGSQLQRKSPERWLAGFDAAQLQERRVEKVHDSLARTLALSLDELEATERRLYVALAIFREDEATPMPGIGKLWAGLVGYSEDQTVDLLHDLAARALLQIVDSATDGVPAAVVIHDLLRDFMGAELGEAGWTETSTSSTRLSSSKSVEPLAEVGRLVAHRAIVEAYRQTQTGDGWATVPDDGYLYEHLVYHLDKLADHDASAITELQSLFANDAWLQVRVSGAGYQYDGYLADLDVVWWRAHQETLRQIEAGEEPATFAECVRYALIRTSINSLSSNYEPALVARAVETGLWSDQRAFSVALRIPDAKSRHKMLTSILGVSNLQPTVRVQAADAQLAAILAIEDGLYRVEALAALAQHLPSEVLAKELTRSMAIKDPLHRSQALRVLASYLSDEEKARALAQSLLAACEVDYAEHRAAALGALVAHLSDDRQAWAFTQGLIATQESKDPLWRTHALSMLGPYLTVEDKAKAVAQGLATSRTTGDSLELFVLMPHLSEEDRAQVLADIQAIENPIHRVMALGVLAPYLSDEDKAQAIAQGLVVVKTIETSTEYGPVLGDLISLLSKEKQEYAAKELLTLAQEIKDPWVRATLLTALVPHLSEEEKAQVLTQRLAAIQLIDRWSHIFRTSKKKPRLPQRLLKRMLATEEFQVSRKESLTVKMAPYLSGGLLAQSLSFALTINDKVEFDLALATLSRHLLAESVSTELYTIHVDDNLPFLWSLFGLAELWPHLSEEGQSQALAQWLAVLKKVNDPNCYSIATDILVPYLSEEDKAEVLVYGLVAAEAIENPIYRTLALARLMPHLSGQNKAEALAQSLATVQAIPHEEHRVEALLTLVGYLPEESKEQVLEELLAAVQGIQDEQRRILILCSLLPHLSEEDRTEVLAQVSTAIQAFLDPEMHSILLTVLAPHLSEEDKAQVAARLLTAAGAINHEQDVLKVEQLKYVQVVVRLEPYILERDRPGILAQALAVARAIEDERDRSQALAALVPYLTNEDKAQALAQGLAAALAIEDKEDQAWALTELIPHLLEEDKAEALVQALASVGTLSYGRARIKVLAKLAPHLPKWLLADELATTRAVDDEGFRAQVVHCLAPYLPEDLLSQGLAIAYAIRENSAARSLALVALIPYLLGDEKIQAVSQALADLASYTLGDSLTRFLRLHVTNHLWNNLRYRKREDLLLFCGDTEISLSPFPFETQLFSPSHFDSRILSAIAADIAEICQHWTWL